MPLHVIMLSTTVYHSANLQCATEDITVCTFLQLTATKFDHVLHEVLRSLSVFRIMVDSQPMLAVWPMCKSNVD